MCAGVVAVADVTRKIANGEGVWEAGDCFAGLFHGVGCSDSAALTMKFMLIHCFGVAAGVSKAQSRQVTENLE